jgi:pyrroline-5-carboxylate reductase
LTDNSRSQQSSQLRNKTIAVLGAGKMGGLITRALLDSGAVDAQRLRATVEHEKEAREVRPKLGGVGVGTSNADAVRGADVVLICVKPNQAAKVLGNIRPALSRDALVLSIVTGVSTEAIESMLEPGTPVVRAMPNTACRIGRGMTALCPGKCSQPSHMEMAEAVFSLMGATAEVDEIHMDAVTGLSASGPAFIYIVLEALAEGGVRVGLSREIATIFAANAALGAASMVLSTGSHPAVLKDEVTTPAGCTIDGIMELEEGNIRATLIKAITTTTRKAGQLARS